MAKSILNTLITWALKAIFKDSKGAKQASPGTPVSSAPKAADSAVASSMNFEKIKFGPYDWLVLERKGDTALIITEGIAQRIGYHAEKKGTTWENSNIRKHLNGKFLEKFSPDEIARIVEVTIQNPDNPWFKTPISAVSVPGAPVCDPKGGNPTKDKVFCLSIEEACRYFGDSTARLKNKGFTIHGAGRAAKITFDSGYKFGDETRISDQNDKNRIAIIPAAISPLKEKKDAPFRWWLRSPGEADVLAAEVDNMGKINMTGNRIFATEDRDRGGTRPALWLKM